MTFANILFALFLAVVVAIPFLFLWYLDKRKMPDEPMEGIEGLADTDLICVPFKGEWLTLAKIDYLQRWLFMNRSQKSEILEEQKRAIKKGQMKKHHFGEDGAYQTLPTDKGKHFQKIHQLKKEIYSETK